MGTDRAIVQPFGDILPAPEEAGTFDERTRANLTERQGRKVTGLRTMV